MDIAKKLSVNLKSYREEKELPQSACAQELGIAKATLQKLEKGDPVSSQTIQHVINRMGMELVLTLIPLLPSGEVSLVSK